jgi:hypothetical protein
VSPVYACNMRQQIGLFLILSCDIKWQSFHCSCKQTFNNNKQY